jgi:hypothetical protein
MPRPDRWDGRARNRDMTTRAVLAPVAASLALALLPSTAVADGLPAVGIDASPLAAPGGDTEYLTKSGKRSTRLVEQARYGGTLRERRIAGTFSLPAVAYDGSPAGIAADGRTLVLISPRTRYPRKRTTFAVVDPRTLRVRRHIALKGDFSFDAISPNGRLMYLVQYNPRNYGEYDVRAYDLRAGRLFPKPVVDPREPDEEMYGVPVTRATSADGRWAYTLYNSEEHPFVHALDTSGRTAACIDLDDVGNAWGATLELRGPRDPGGPRLDVVGKGERVLASIDTRTNRVIDPPAPPAKSDAANDAGADDAGTSWLQLAAPTAALLLLAAITRRRIGLKRARSESITG